MERKDHLVIFQNITFDKEAKTFTILKGSEGTYPYTELKSCEILNEDAKFTGKGEPFTHTVLCSPMQRPVLFPRGVYVGARLKMKDGTNRYVYLSNEVQQPQSFPFYDDVKEGENLKEFVKKIVKKYA